MRLYTPATATRIDAGLAVLRVVTGIIFAAHGAQKLFVYGLDGVTGSFTQLGIPMAALAAPAVAVVELLGGLTLVAGLLTRLAGVGLAITMTGALFFAHLNGGFFLPNGYEYVLALMASAVTLAITGPGRLSLDAQIGARRERATG